MDETRLIASLPHLDIALSRSQDHAANAEIITIQFRATPSLDAAAQFLAPRLLEALPLMLLGGPLAGAGLGGAFGGSGVGGFVGNGGVLGAWQALSRRYWAPWFQLWGLALPEEG